MKRKPGIMHRWLFPGLGLKRWAVLGGVAIALIIIGIWSMVNNQHAKDFTIAFVNFMQRTLPSLSFGQGLFCAALGILGGVFCVRNFLSQYSKISHETSEMDEYYERKALENGPRIVAIGGGTGLSVLLRGLKAYTSNITAAVSVGDDGGSSGRLRKDFDVVPVGDIRSCIVALADEEDVMEKVFSYRFGRGEGLKGHSLGNLLLIGLTNITGNFQEAISNVDQILHMSGRVLPITEEPLVLKAQLADGTELTGESLIGETEVPIRRLTVDPPYAQVLPEVLDAIDEADAIILGPGSLYTSVIPNLCVSDVVDAIRASRARVFYVCNITAPPGESEGYTAADHLQAIYDHSCPEMIDYMLVDDGSVQPRVELADILLANAQRVVVDHDRLKDMHTKVVETTLVSDSNPYHHDSGRLALAIMDTLYRDRDFRMRRGLLQSYWDYQRIRQIEEDEDELFQ